MGSHNFVFDAERIGPWVCEKAGGEYRHGNTAIGLEYEGVLIAGIMYEQWTGASIIMSSRVDDQKHVNRSFYWVIFDYVFTQLKAKRCTLLVSTANITAQKVNEKLGFKREATLRDYFPDGGGIVYRMTRDECRWLEVKHDSIKAAA